MINYHGWLDFSIGVLQSYHVWIDDNIGVLRTCCDSSTAAITQYQANLPVEDEGWLVLDRLQDYAVIWIVFTK